MRVFTWKFLEIVAPESVAERFPYTPSIIPTYTYTHVYAYTYTESNLCSQSAPRFQYNNHLGPAAWLPTSPSFCLQTKDHDDGKSSCQYSYHCNHADGSMVTLELTPLRTRTNRDALSEMSLESSHCSRKNSGDAALTVFDPLFFLSIFTKLPKEPTTRPPQIKMKAILQVRLDS